MQGCGRAPCTSPLAPLMDAPSPRPPRPRRPSQPAQLNVHVPEGYLAVGRIVGVHGLRGEVKVEPYTDHPERFAPGTILALGDDLEGVEIRSMRPHKNVLLIAFEEFAGRDAVELLRGLWLFVPEAEATPLEENTYRVHDILGMEVVSDDGAALGVVVDVLFTGANEVYVVRAPQESGGRELLLPATDEVVLAVDVPGRRMTVHLLPGITD